MIRIDVLDKIADNMEVLDYKIEKTSSVYVYSKEKYKFVLDIDVKEVRFYVLTKKWNYQKSFAFEDFEKVTYEWIKKHKLLK